LEEKQLMANNNWLLSGMPVLCEDALRDSSVRCNSSPGWVDIPIVVMKIECWGIWDRMYKQKI
jgi:hypothetical protein